MSEREIESIVLKVNLKTRLGEVIEAGTRYFPPFPNFIMKEIGRSTVEVVRKTESVAPPVVHSTLMPDPPVDEKPVASKVARRRK